MISVSGIGLILTLSSLALRAPWHDRAQPVPVDDPPPFAKPPGKPASVETPPLKSSSEKQLQAAFSSESSSAPLWTASANRLAKALIPADHAVERAIRPERSVAAQDEREQHPILSGVDPVGHPPMSQMQVTSQSAPSTIGNNKREGLLNPVLPPVNHQGVSSDRLATLRIHRRPVRSNYSNLLLQRRL